MEKGRAVLSENLKALMSTSSECSTRALLRKKAKLGGGSVDGAVNGTTGATIDTIEALAKAFGLHPWQLLVPQLDPKNPPVVHLSEAEKKFYRRIEEKMHLLQEELRSYITDGKKN